MSFANSTKQNLPLPNSVIRELDHHCDSLFSFSPLPLAAELPLQTIFVIRKLSFSVFSFIFFVAIVEGPPQVLHVRRRHALLLFDEIPESQTLQETPVALKIESFSATKLIKEDGCHFRTPHRELFLWTFPFSDLRTSSSDHRYKLLRRVWFFLLAAGASSAPPSSSLHHRSSTLSLCGRMTGRISLNGTMQSRQRVEEVQKHHRALQFTNLSLDASQVESLKNVWKNCSGDDSSSNLSDQDLKKAPNGHAVMHVKDLLPRGLVNYGNLCFLNATMQALMACSSFVQLLQELRTRNIPKVGCPTLTAFAESVTQFDMPLPSGTKSKKKDTDS